MTTNTVYIKMMNGDIIPLEYKADNFKNKTDEFIESILSYKKGYTFSLFKGEKEYKDFSSISSELKDEDIINIVLYPKTFDVTIIYLGDSLMVKDEKDKAWTRGDLYLKFLMSIKQNLNDESNLSSDEKNEEKNDLYFYTKKNIYIPYDSVKIVNYMKYDDEDHIMINNNANIFRSIKDMTKFMLKDKYCDDICDTIIDTIIMSWNDGKIDQIDFYY